jgi:hypothetical protein
MAQEAGFVDPRFEEILRLKKDKGRIYPLFLMQARKP